MKKSIVVFVISVLCLPLVWGQVKSLNIGKVASKNYLSVIKFEMMGDKLIVPVTINGKRYRFLFDTGAPTIISKELDSLLQPKQLGRLNTSDATGKRSRLKVVALESLYFGDVEFIGTASLVYDLNESPIFQCWDIDGFIGSNMLRKSIIQIDSQTKTMILTNNRKNLVLDKKQSTKLRLTQNQSNPYVWIQLKGKESAREELLIDMGADDLYDLSKSHLKPLSEKDIFEIKAKAEGASSVSLFGDAPVNTQYQVLLPKLVVNGYEIKNVVAETTSDNNSRIGASLLRYGKITLDYKGKRFYFQPHSKPFPKVRYEFGFSSTYLNGKLSVGFVWKEELKSKLSYGDEILAINGVEMNAGNLCDLVADRIDSRSNKVLNLTVKNSKGEIQDLRLLGELFTSE